MKEKIFILTIILVTLGLRIIGLKNTSEIWVSFWSVLIIAVIYFIIKRYDLHWARASAIFLAVSPWLIIFSRNYFSLFGPLDIVFSAKEILQNYFSFFSPKYLFFGGIWPNSTKDVSYQGMMYLPDIIFLFFGLKELVFKEKNVIGKTVVYLFFVFPFLLSVVKGGLFFNFIAGIIMVLISAKGLSCLAEKQKKLFYPFVIIYLLFFIRFIDLYFVHQ